MASRVDELAVELLGLPTQDRALLAQQLISSLDESRTSNAQALWLKEAQRRSEEIDQGAVVCTPAEEVFREARKRRS